MNSGLVIGLILLVGVTAQWVAWRIRIPAIILLSAAGLLLGPVTGALHFSYDTMHMIEPIIGLAVAVILFEGGLNLQRHELDHAGPVVRRLASVCVVLAAVFGTLAAIFVGGLSWQTSLVFGAMMVVTGPTVIMPMLRQAGLNKRVSSYLKWEGIVNDPVGVLVAVIIFQGLIYAGPDATWQITLYSFLRAFAAALILGWLVGYLLGRAFRAGLVPEYLKFPIVLGVVLSAFAGSNAFQSEAGLLTVTVMGITMGNMNLRSIEEMRRFKEYLTVILVSMVFVVLTAALTPDVLAKFGWRDGLLVLTFMFVVRPASVWLGTIGSGASTQERLLMSWIAPRGIVAAATAGVFAGPMILAKYYDADKLQMLTFALIFATVLAHGLTIAPLGRLLGLSVGKTNGLIIIGSSPWSIAFSSALMKTDVTVLVADTSWRRLRLARQAELPTYYGEILSEHAEDSLELTTHRTLLAATNNDAYNALVCSHFAFELGRSQVHQLPMYTGDKEDPRGLGDTKRGVVIFTDGMIYEELDERIRSGWVVKSKVLAEQYDYEAMWNELDPEAMELAKVTAKGELKFFEGKPLQAKVDDTVLVLCPPQNEGAV